MVGRRIGTPFLHEPILVEPRTLRAGALGPENGRFLVQGWALGASVAGLILAVHALSTLVPFIWPGNIVIRLPILTYSSPFYEGVIWCIVVLLADAIGHLLPPRCRHVAVTALIAGVMLGSRIEVFSKPAGFVIAIAIAAIFLSFAKSGGIAAMLSATLTAFSLPAAAFAVHQWHWMPGTATAMIALSLGPLAVGAIGLFRSADADQRRPEALRCPSTRSVVSPEFGIPDR